MNTDCEGEPLPPGTLVNLPATVVHSVGDEFVAIRPKGEREHTVTVRAKLVKRFPLEQQPFNEGAAT